jgi:hypothetical protein
MYTIIRIYSGSPGLAEALQKNIKAIKTEMGSVAGFVSYQLITTSIGATSITVCESARGCEESSKRASDWLRNNLPDLKIQPPVVQSGEVCFQFSRAPALV